MSYLYQVLTQRVDAWRTANYPCDAFPAIREILEFATEDGETDQLRYPPSRCSQRCSTGAGLGLSGVADIRG